MKKLDLEIKLRFSKHFLFLLGIIAGGGLIIIWELNFSFNIKILISIITIFYTIYIINNSKLSAIGFNANGWRLKKGQKTFFVQLSGDSTITNLVCILLFTQSRKMFKKSAIIFKDMMPPDDYRRLLIALRNS